MDNNINITSAQYIQHENKNHTIKAIKDGTVMFAPLDPNNRHYAEILKQVEAGKLTIKDAD